MHATTAQLLTPTDADSARAEGVGSKAAHLKALADMEFDVPPWVTIPTGAYEAAVADICNGRAELPDSVVAERLLGYTFPAELAEAIVRASVDVVTDAGTDEVAVRSSCTAEDLVRASFAGQYDTVLNVRAGSDDVLDAVRQCWASMWSAHATSYQSQVATDEKPRMAVIVQRMVDAAAAGVMHTANPLTGSRCETVIEAVPGLGEGVVAGTVSPDHYVVGAASDVPIRGCLTPAQLRQLYELGAALTASFGEPQDVEWAFDRTGELMLTQTRPITTLFPSPIDPADPNRAFWSVNVYQGLTQPFTPIGSDFIRQRQRGMQTYMAAIGFNPDLIDVDGWLYWDITAGVTDARKRPGMVAFTNRIAAPSGDLIDALVTRGRISQTSPHAYTDTQPRPRKWRTLLPVLLFPTLAHTRARRCSDAHVAALRTHSGHSMAERFSYVRERFEDVCRIEAAMPRTANTAGHTALEIATGLLHGYATEADISAAFKGVPRNPTTEMDLALWRAAVRIAEHPTARAEALASSAQELERGFLGGTLDDVLHNEAALFLTEYGCRATAEIDLGVPRWNDQPAPVFAMIANYIHAIDSGTDAAADFAAARRQAQRAVRELASRIPWRRHPLRRIGVLWLLTAARHLKGLRELPKLCLMRGFADLRTQLLIIGGSLESNGIIGNAADIVFLHLDEIEKAIEGNDFRDTIAARRDRYRDECARTRIPAVTLSDGTSAELPSATAGHTDVLHGIAASTGTVTGPACIITDPHTAVLNDGEILVCPSTDPGWTPLFLTAAALVTETGGMISHGTTVAREYGIPAVVGVHEATTIIRAGQLITVDGATGTVTVAKRAS